MRQVYCFTALTLGHEKSKMGGRDSVFSVLLIIVEKLVDLNVRLFQVAPYCVLLLFLMAGTWYFLRLYRAYLSKTDLAPVNYLESFQKLRDEGKLTEEEFRIIRKRLSLQMSQILDKPNSNSPRPSDTPPRNR